MSQSSLFSARSRLDPVQQRTEQRDLIRRQPAENVTFHLERLGHHLRVKFLSGERQRQQV